MKYSFGLVAAILIALTSSTLAPCRVATQRRRLGTRFDATPPHVAMHPAIEELAHRRPGV